MADSSSLTAPSSTESVKLRFRLHDGTDVGPVDMPLTATVGEVKEAVLAAWPPVRSQLEAILVTINCTRAGASGCCSGSSRAVIVAYVNPQELRLLRPPGEDLRPRGRQRVEVDTLWSLAGG
jgi:hypothetical protein